MIRFVDKLKYLHTRQTDVPDTWLRMGNCHHHLGNTEAAINLFLSGIFNLFQLNNCEIVIEVNPDDIDTKLALAELYEETGELDLSKQLADEGGQLGNW